MALASDRGKLQLRLVVRQPGVGPDLVISGIPSDCADPPKLKHGSPPSDDTLQDVGREGPGWWFILKADESLTEPLPVQTSTSSPPPVSTRPTRRCAASKKCPSSSEAAAEIPRLPREGEIFCQLTAPDHTTIFALPNGEYRCKNGRASKGDFHVDHRRTNGGSDRLVLRIHDDRVVAIRLFVPLRELPSEFKRQRGIPDFSPPDNAAHSISTTENNKENEPPTKRKKGVRFAGTADLEQVRLVSNTSDKSLQPQPQVQEQHQVDDLINDSINAAILAAAKQWKQTKLNEAEPPRILPVRHPLTDSTVPFNIFHIPVKVDTRSLTASDLRKELSFQGLDTSGSRAQLLQRLEDHLTQQQQQQQQQPKAPSIVSV